MLQKITGFFSKILYRWAKQLEKTNDLKQETYSECSKHLTFKKYHYLSHITKS